MCRLSPPARAAEEAPVPKAGEIGYLKNLGPEHARFVTDKPFSHPTCGNYLMDLGAILALLPPPRARLLDLGCGSGWTSCFFALRGYDVTGQDICPDMITRAHVNKERYNLGDNLRFIVSDYEEMGFEAEFDCAVFFDALHHAVDEGLALQCVARALRPGGVCITSEPGVGHARSEDSQFAIHALNVTERDMPATRIIAAARAAGFTTFQVFPHISRLGVTIYRQGRLDVRTFLKRLGWALFCSRLARHRGGIVLMKKAA